MKKRIFLDVDGIVGDLFRLANRLHGNILDYSLYPENQDGIAAAFGMSNKKFWPPLAKHYEDMPHTSEADLLMNLLLKDDVCFLTAPLRNGADAKIRWLQKHYPNHPHILSRFKHYSCGGPNDLLIDDRNHNIDSWKSEQGSAILFPRRWNRRHAEERDYFPDRFIQELQAFREG